MYTAHLAPFVAATSDAAAPLVPREDDWPAEYEHEADAKYELQADLEPTHNYTRCTHTMFSYSITDTCNVQQVDASSLALFNNFTISP